MTVCTSYKHVNAVIRVCSYKFDFVCVCVCVCVCVKERQIEIAYNYLKSGLKLELWGEGGVRPHTLWRGSEVEGFCHVL